MCLLRLGGPRVAGLRLIRRIGCIIVITASVNMSARAADPSTNLLGNGGFEEAGSSAWEKRTPDGPDRSLEIADGPGHSGQHYARIINRRPTISRWRQGADAALKAEPGSVVRVSGWIRSDLGPEGYATLRLYCMGKGGEILQQPQARPIAGKSEWNRRSLTATVPPSTDHLMVYLELQNAVGMANFDDIALSIVARPEPRQRRDDLLLMTDASPDDPVVRSLQTLYPGRFVPAPLSDKVGLQKFSGAVVFARQGERVFDADALGLFAASGRTVVIDLGAYARWRSLGTREVRSESPSVLRVAVQHPATRGFQVGDVIPWGARKENGWIQTVLVGKPPGQILCESTAGDPLAVLERAGDGLILAIDLCSLPEPAHNLPGAFNKYLFLGNVLGEGVKHGCAFERRWSYAEFVDKMRELAAREPAIRFEDEGPATAGMRIHSLNIGDAQKPAFLIYAATHGSEWEPAYGLFALARLLATDAGKTLFDDRRYCVKLIPILNPSGYQANTRKNANGVDLNRNGGEWWETFKGRDSDKDGTPGPGDNDWKGSAPFSEPETQTLRAICDRVTLRAALDFHGNAGGRGNNRLVILPLTALDDNEERADAAVRAFNTAIRDRFVFLEATRPGVEQYEIEAVHVDGQRPTLMETVCKNRYGFLCEVPAGYAGTYGLVTQTDIVIETCLAFLRAYRQ